MKTPFRLFAAALAFAIGFPVAIHAQIAGSLDPAFNPDANGEVATTAVQPDGKTVLGGNFTTVGAQTRNRIARLQADGTLESMATFNPGTGANAKVFGVAVQADGKILLAGDFTTVNGQTRNRIARLNADGTLESTVTFNPGTSANARVWSVAVQADGKILLAGDFTTVNGQARNRIARLNANGTVESTATFNPGTGANNTLSSVAVQADGKILIGGSFTTVNGLTRNRIARLNADGTVESTATFNPGAGVDNSVNRVLVQADGKILVGGLFTTVNGQTRSNLARLNADGTLESTATFNPGTGPNGTVGGVTLLADGKILLVGGFGNVDGMVRTRIARLNADGTLETTVTFDAGTGADSFVDDVAVQADGKILLSGFFTAVNGQVRNRIARLANDAAIQTLTSPDSARAQWARSGAAPEVEQVTFELSTNAGASWSALGAGTRIAGGWEKTGLSLPGNGFLRARGRTGSSGLVEQVALFGPAGPEIAVEQPANNNLSDGGTLSFGRVGVGANTSHTFIIRNTGNSNLTGLGITVDGPDAAMFTVTASPSAPVSAGGSTTFTVRFTHSSAGDRTAALHIASNDADENPFDLTLTGSDLSNDANLSNLTLSAGPLSPVFGAATTSYTASVPYATASTTVTPTTAFASATVKVNGVTVTSGTASSAIALSAGSNIITVVVTAEDGAATKTYTATVTRAALPPGTVDPDFNPNVPPPGAGSDPYTVRVAAVQPDEKIVIAGNFATVGGQSRDSLARLNADGTVESTATFVGYDPVGTGGSSASGVYSVALQPDGKILLGGAGNNGRFGRINPNGTAESLATFNPGSGPDDRVLGVALQPDGKILLVGDFFYVNGFLRSSVARLQANGAVESTATFNPVTGTNNGIAYCVAVQADGKILLGGDFLYVAGAFRDRIARLNADGTLGNFAGAADSTVHCVAVQPDGKILLGGDFTAVNGQARTHIARLNADGTVESTTTFNPGAGANGTVHNIALQADGKILLAGGFTTFSGQPRNAIARLNADGTLESTATFNPGTGPGGPLPSVDCIALQADGNILLGGGFATMNGLARNKIARLANNAATQNLTASDSARVQWTRGGAAPEIEQVNFDVSTDGGANWSPLGIGTRIAGGWERTGLSLPPTGSLRARGRTSGGYRNGTSGVVEQVAQFTLPVPEITLEQPAGTPLADGTGNVSFGTVTLGSNSTRIFTIKNTSTADLTGLGITIDGTDAAAFAVTAAPTAPVPGPSGSTTFTVTFTPGSAGAKSAALHLASNDADENPYDIALTGIGLTRLESWRLTYFGSAANSGPGADDNDFDNDGPVNLMEFATHRDPTQPGGAIGVLSKNGTALEFRYQRAKAAVLDGLSFAVEWSDTLGLGSWSTVDVSEAILTDDGTVQEILATLPMGDAERRFVRLRVDAQ